MELPGGHKPSLGVLSMLTETKRRNYVLVQCCYGAEEEEEEEE